MTRLQWHREQGPRLRALSRPSLPSGRWGPGASERPAHSDGVWGWRADASLSGRVLTLVLAGRDAHTEEGTRAGWASQMALG